MYVFAELPLGLSYERQQQLGKVWRFSARSTPIKKFYNNVAHSYRRVGHILGCDGCIVSLRCAYGCRMFFHLTVPAHIHYHNDNDD